MPRSARTHVHSRRSHADSASTSWSPSRARLTAARALPGHRRRSFWRPRERHDDDYASLAPKRALGEACFGSSRNPGPSAGDPGRDGAGYRDWEGRSRAGGISVVVQRHAGCAGGSPKADRGGKAGQGGGRWISGGCATSDGAVRAAGVASFFKQSAGPRLEMRIELDGQLVRAFPRPRVGSAGARGPA
jgi:hypothetical protein